jgi:hypothetical protein
MIRAFVSIIKLAEIWQGHRRRATGLGLLVTGLLAVAIVFSGCAATHTSTGAFTDLKAIETRLQLQSSTKADVEKLLGAPAGYGGMALPYAPIAREVWFYQDLEATDATARPGGIIEMTVRQQILLVFFQGGFFDGFMWYSTAIPALGKTP